jgi:hypothetical protein
MELGSTIRLLSISGGVRGDGTGRTIAHDLEPVGIEALGNEVELDRLGATLTEFEVVFHQTLWVGVSGDFDPTRVFPQNSDHSVEHLAPVGRNPSDVEINSKTPRSVLY